MIAVSVLIRTIGRQPALKDALDSLLMQSLKDFEVVIVEDGPAKLPEFLSGYSSEAISLSLQGEGRGEGGARNHPLLNLPPEGGGNKLRIRYEALGSRKGRSTAGNRAMELAQGQYCLFLDEDDLLYPDHLKLLVDAARGSGKAVAYSWSEERAADRAPDGTFTRKGRLKRYRRERFSLLHLMAGNFLPINAVLFERALFTKAGGFDTDIDCLEDWLLWLRYAAVEPDWLCVPRVTAVFHTPLARGARRKAFREWHAKVHERMRSIKLTCSVQALNHDLRTHFSVAIFLRKLYYYVTGFIRWS